jgi:hypothetical protein
MEESIVLRSLGPIGQDAVRPNVGGVDVHQHSGEFSASPVVPFRHRGSSGCRWVVIASIGSCDKSRARQGVRQTTDQLRTTTAKFSAPRRSTMDTGDKGFTFDNRGGPIWGSRGCRGRSTSARRGSGSDLRFRNGAGSHEAAAKESTYA